MVVRHVADSREYVVARFGDPGDWHPLPGRDTVSEVFRTGDHVVKVQTLAPFEASMLSRVLRDVHGALAPRRLAPELRWICYDGATMATAFAHVPPAAAPADPESVGAALARAHGALARVGGRTSEPWVGFYGEHHEFAMTTPAVADEELRELGLRLLSYARRGDVPGPYHYVHRDLHPGNVVAGADGPCLVDWDLAHVGSAVDDLAMTACMWAAESPGPPDETAGRVLAGYSEQAGVAYTLRQPVMRAAIALAGLRQGVAAWFTDHGDCAAPYWPFVRRRIRVAAQLLAA